MTTPIPPPVITRDATEHGWLRRPELDGANFDAWERPDGSIKAVPCGATPILHTLRTKGPVR